MSTEVAEKILPEQFGTAEELRFYLGIVLVHSRFSGDNAPDVPEELEHDLKKMCRGRAVSATTDKVARYHIYFRGCLDRLDDERVADSLSEIPVSPCDDYLISGIQTGGRLLCNCRTDEEDVNKAVQAAMKEAETLLVYGPVKE